MNDKKQLQLNEEGKKDLTPKNLKYIQLRLEEGLTPQYAYHKAGYTGTAYSAPYEMESYLKPELQKIVEMNGINKHNLMVKAKRLIDLPIREIENDTPISVKTHIQCLKLADKLIPENDSKRPTISPIIIKTGNGPTQVNVGDGPNKDTPTTLDTTDNTKSDDTHAV